MWRFSDAMLDFIEISKAKTNIVSACVCRVLLLQFPQGKRSRSVFISQTAGWFFGFVQSGLCGGAEIETIYLPL
jgi:hypothetical protein